MSENEKKKEIYEELVNQFEESEVQIISKIQKKINKLIKRRNIRNEKN